MTKATAIVRKAAVKAERVVDTVTLDHVARETPLAHLTTDAGLHLHLELPEGSQLNDGDALKLEDGGLVAVKAVDEKLLEVKAENPLRLMRVLWHLGQNHTPVEVTAEAVYVAQDDAVAELVRGQGCSLAPVDRPFRPERAIAGHDCGHDHHGHAGHGHAHHGHSHDDHHGHHHHEHKHEHAHHAHGAACGCGHDHHDHADHHHGHDDLAKAHAKGHHSHEHAHDHEDDAAHGHRHHSHAHHGHDHGKD